jgi:tight adherence protein B
VLGFFLLVLALTFTIMLVLTRAKPSEKQTQVRLNTLVKLQEVESSAGLGLEKVTRNGLSERMTERFQRYAMAASIQRKLMYSGSKWSVGKWVLVTLMSAVGCAVALDIFLGVLPLVAVAFVVGAWANYWLLNFKCSRRLKKFNEVLPDAIELLARALRAGHSTASAIEVVAQQSQEPLGSEFSKCAQQQRFGIPFRDVMLALAERMPSQDLHFLVTAILVQKETGGDLTEILDRTTEVIRDRIRIQGEIRTYTAQGRLTGWILSAMPVGLLGLISVLSPSYSHVLFTDPLGEKLLYAGAGFIVLGAVVIRKIVDIKV